MWVLWWPMVCSLRRCAEASAAGVASVARAVDASAASATRRRAEVRARMVRGGCRVREMARCPTAAA